MVEYGITTSKAFLWAHVCPLDASIYWYRREEMLALIERSPSVEIKSARGRLVAIHGNVFPAGNIHDSDLGYDFFDRWPWDSAKSDKDVGAFAEQCFSVAVRERRLTLPVHLDRYNSVGEQYQGKDFRCRTNYDVEIKADIPGGVWGTGNLFVQTHELHHQHHTRNAHRESGATQSI